MGGEMTGERCAGCKGMTPASIAAEKMWEGLSHRDLCSSASLRPL